MGDWWTCNRCGHVFGEFGVDRPSGCTQCHSADLAPGLTPPTERLAALEKAVRELKAKFHDWFTFNDKDLPERAGAYRVAELELGSLMSAHGISPDGEGGG